MAHWAQIVVGVTTGVLSGLLLKIIIDWLKGRSSLDKDRKPKISDEMRKTIEEMVKVAGECKSILERMEQTSEKRNEHVDERDGRLFKDINNLRDMVFNLGEKDTVNGMALKEIVKNIDQVVTRLIDFSGNLQVLLSDVNRIYTRLDSMKG